MIAAATPPSIDPEFTLRRGLTFHNGDPLTYEDLKLKD